MKKQELLIIPLIMGMMLLFIMHSSGQTIIDDGIFVIKKTKSGNLSMNIKDNDADKIYFEGNFFEVDISSSDIPGAADGTTPKIEAQYIYTDPNTPTEHTVIESPTVSEIINQTFTISGDISKVTKAGAIGFKVSISTYNIGPFPVFDSVLYNENDESDYGMAIVGVKIPEGDIISEPDFSDIENLYAANVEFFKTDKGSIRFEGLNIIDERESLHQLQDGMNIFADPEGEEFYVEIDPSNLGFLAREGAVVTLYGVDFDNFAIHVTDFAQEASTDDPIDQTANNSANIEDGVLTFNVDRFSRYSALEEAEETFVDTPVNFELTVFPNPANEKITVETSKTIKQVQLISISGQVIKDIKLDAARAEINVNNLHTGIYFIKIHMEDSVITERVQITR